jgi:membrane protein DedA with SNARE-associated domain
MFVHAIERLLEAVGLPLVFFGVGIESMGVPLPGETILVIASVAAGAGKLVPWQVALVGWAGAVIGDNIGYSLGHHYGERFWTLPGVRRHATRERVDRVEGFFKRRRGWLVVFLARFVAILRIFAGPVAGISHMHWRSFFLANAGGAAVWVALVTTVGLLVGNNLDRAVKIVERTGYGGLALAIVLVVALAFLWWRRERHRRDADEPA